MPSIHPLHVLRYRTVSSWFWLTSGSVVECLTRERGVAGSSLTGVTALCPWARHIYPRLVLVHPRKTRPCLTERLLMGCKESNQINKQTNKQNKKNMYKCLAYSSPFLASLLDYATANRCIRAVSTGLITHLIHVLPFQQGLAFFSFNFASWPTVSIFTIVDI